LKIAHIYLYFGVGEAWGCIRADAKLLTFKIQLRKGVFMKGRNVMKKLIYLLSALVLSSAFFTACDGGGSGSSPATYTVTYNANGASGGTVPADSADYQNGQSVAVLGNTGNLVLTGYGFAGWNTAPDGSGTTYITDQTFPMGSGNVVLYAKWQLPFVTTWQTDNSGTSNNDQITIPVASGETYDYTVDWGDGTIESNLTGEATHTYTSTGTKTVRISGTFPRIYFNYSGDKDKFLTIEKWGEIEWTSMAKAFYGCSNLTYNATDAPDLSDVTDMSYMFSAASSFNGSIGSWDVSNVTNMKGVFAEASAFNKDIGNWKVSNVTDMSYMFLSASAFNQDIGGWDVGKVTLMVDMFNNADAFNQNIENWTLSNVTHMNSMFANTSSFNQDISGWIVSSVTSMSYMFYYATGFSGHDLSGWDVSSVTEYANFSDSWGSGNTAPVWNQ
jgi:uncharacterized repeat protein (TIGR02543 family)